MVDVLETSIPYSFSQFSFRNPNVFVHYCFTVSRSLANMGLEEHTRVRISLKHKDKQMIRRMNPRGYYIYHCKSRPSDFLRFFSYLRYKSVPCGRIEGSSLEQHGTYQLENIICWSLWKLHVVIQHRTHIYSWRKRSWSSTLLVFRKLEINKLG
jgi:hypothetical protein